MSTAVSTTSSTGSPKRSTIALVGRPNSGKSSLYNRMTGGNARVGNYPGITVDVLEAELTLPSGTTGGDRRSSRALLGRGRVEQDTDEGVARTSSTAFANA